MEDNYNLWWGPPRNFADRQNERKISWLELFYDLVYVAAVGQLTHHIAAHPTWQSVGYAFLLFSLVFWSWVNGSQYYDLHGNDSIRTRLFTFLQMLAVAGVAITIQDAFEGHQQGFVIAFSVVQLMITYLWWSVGLFDRSHRIFNRFFTTNYLLALLAIIISYFTTYEVATLLWGVALLLNLTPGLIGARTIVRVVAESGQVFSASAAIVERFGLFAIIVLAESILATVSGVAEVKDKHPTVWIAFILGILIAFLLWCLYFDMTSEQETKKGYSYMQWLVFLHYPLLGAFCVVGGCIKTVLADIDTPLPSGVQWMFCVALAVTVFMIVGIARIMEEEEEDRVYIRPVSRLLIGIGIVLLVIPLFGQYLSNLAFLGILAGVLFIPVFIGIRSWVRYKFFSQQHIKE
ncbi:MAG: low temperature requirement protein A [Chitinophaga sp.]|uniref:low temperature requirement protein A n=1 Tax=Chitinophaga sp. TaxID=1869181 RepID=UPI001B035BA2|nr:low temperature requirement protein A [Chitinophaga sp.]MBO9728549.1 low temperature requirement protein A [Chitinophaga sp.]